VVERSEHHRRIEASTFRIPPGCQRRWSSRFSVRSEKARRSVNSNGDLRNAATQMTALFRGVSLARRVWHPAGMHIRCDGLPAVFAALDRRLMAAKPPA